MKRVFCLVVQVELNVLALANVGVGEERAARKMIHKAMAQVRLSSFQHHTANSPFVLPHITSSRDVENFAINQRNSCLAIIMMISFILMTSLTEKALIVQREI